MDERVPVIAIDGTAASGKGTLAELLSSKLGWHRLDSGLLYRIVAYAALIEGVNSSNAHAVTEFIDHDFQISPYFVESELRLHNEPRHATVYLGSKSQQTTRYEGADVTTAVRTDEVSLCASRVANIASVRNFLKEVQRKFRREPGLIADGRDMGTVVFPDASLKFYVDGELAVRARRRQQQLKQDDQDADLKDIEGALLARDRVDSSRDLAPLKPAADAIQIDSTHLTIDEMVAYAFTRVYEHGLQP